MAQSYFRRTHVAVLFELAAQAAPVIHAPIDMLSAWGSQTAHAAYAAPGLSGFALAARLTTSALNTKHMRRILLNRFQAIDRLESFIYRHREKARDVGSALNLAFHGLRYNYACGQYVALRNKGYSDFQACKQVSLWMGHERADVTKKYLVSVRKKGGELIV